MKEERGEINEARALASLLRARRTHLVQHYSLWQINIANANNRITNAPSKYSRDIGRREKRRGKYEEGEGSKGKSSTCKLSKSKECYCNTVQKLNDLQ